MELHDFIEKFAEQFDDMDVASLSPDTEFKSLEDWTSLMALSIIAMVDEEYNVSINGNDIRQANTIRDLFGTVESKL